MERRDDINILKDSIQVTKRYMKMWSKSLIIIEVKNQNNNEIYHLTPEILALSKRNNSNTDVGEDVGGR